MSQCFNIVYLAGGFTDALNDVLQLNANGLAFPVFKLAKNHAWVSRREHRRDFPGVCVKLYAICF
jgi:hypothetical protein